MSRTFHFKLLLFETRAGIWSAYGGMWQTTLMKNLRYPDAWPFDFGGYLKKIREGMNLSMSEAATRSNGKLAPSSISVIERHLLASTPSMRQLEGFSELYGVPVIHLFALAYISEKQLDPNTVDKVWEEFDLERFDDVEQGSSEASVYVHRQQLEQLGVRREQLQHYSLRKAGLLSAEVTHQGFVLDTDVISVDSERTPASGDLVAGWWREKRKLLVYRHNLEERDVVIPAQREGEPYSKLASVSGLEYLGVVVWRSGPTP